MVDIEVIADMRDGRGELSEDIINLIKYSFITSNVIILGNLYLLTFFLNHCLEIYIKL